MRKAVFTVAVALLVSCAVVSLARSLEGENDEMAATQAATPSAAAPAGAAGNGGPTVKVLPPAAGPIAAATAAANPVSGPSRFWSRHAAGGLD